jgi:hypothetical protein
MEKEERKKAFRRMMAHVIFISTPSILLPGYFIYKLRPFLIEWKGIEMSDTVYISILFLAMWLGMYLSSNKIMKELFQGKNESENQP